MAMDQKYAADGLYVGVGGSTLGQIQVTSKETPLSRLQMAVRQVRACRDRTALIASALAGEEPPENTARNEPLARDGFFGCIEDLADEISAITARIDADMNRIERRI